MITIVANPEAGRGKAKAVVEGLIRKSTEPAKVEWTTRPGEATEIARRCYEAGVDRVIAAGGDGTVTEVANAAYQAQLPFGILPVGTGNDFARTLGIFGDLDKAWNVATSGDATKIDCLKWFTGTQSGIAINVAGCGFDASVAELINRGVKFLSGTAAYYFAIVSTLLKYKPIDLEIQIDGQSFKKSAMLCAIANAKSYGGGLKVAPTASITDGKLDAVIVEDFGKIEFLLNFPKLLAGTHLNHPKISHVTGTQVTIIAKEPTPFLVDGELVTGTTFTIELLPSSLSILAPRASE